MAGTTVEDTEGVSDPPIATTLLFGEEHCAGDQKEGVKKSRILISGNHPVTHQESKK
jgi:hypothetical protein